MWGLVMVVVSAALVVGRTDARELDPAACAARFDVQRDKIIRTEESRDMGARYLSELDVGSRHECRRLCCETDACDVFVYEEKSPGSCYLFVCGPPEDFRCKFTAHGNFSSGVLALSRRLAELQDQERLSPPAPAAPPARPAPAPAVPAPPHTTTTLPAPPAPAPPPRPVPTAPPLPAAPHSTPPRPPQKSRCSRYQWECHSGGECIAVYNACDGVPQCADGSDEAPELGCPALPAPPAVPAPAAPASPAPPQQPSPPPPPPMYPVQMYEQEGGGAESAGAGAGGEVRWPHRLLQAQPRRYPGAESMGGPGPALGAAPVQAPAPHIFSHKGGLVQEQPFEPPAAPPAWPRQHSHQHQAVDVGMGMENGWGPGPGAGGWRGAEWGDSRWPWPPGPAPAPVRALPPLPPAPHDTFQMSEFPVGAGGYLPRPMPELPPSGYAAAAAGGPHDQPKKGPPPPLPPPPASAAAAPPPAPPATPPDNGTKKKAAAVHSESADAEASSSSSSKSEPRAAGAGAGAGAVVQMVAAPHGHDEHDGLSERPPAAIMLLVLGVCMTGAVCVVLGRGAGLARRRLRLRRGGKPLAHDADYLVNGMYL